ncbi:MAG: PrsW family glutamic-type intramembrane protease [Candidatus Dormibacteria bacterium]
MGPVTCQHCGETGPEGIFCTRCGAVQDTDERTGRLRLSQFAGRPNEGVVTPALVSSLLPHAGDRHALPFRLALLGGGLALLVLVAAGLLVVAIPVAIVLVPAVYLVTLRRAEVYEREPGQLMAVAGIGGLAGGLLLSGIVDKLIDPAPPGGLGTASLLLLVVLVPLLQEGVKLLPAAAFLRNVHVGDTVDGLTLGVCAGLGFAVGEALVSLTPVVASLPLRVPVAGWYSVVVEAAVLVPLMHATCAGILTAGLWALRQHRVTPLERCAIAVAVAGHVGFAALAHVVNSSTAIQLLVLVSQAVLVTVLLMTMRLLLHAALLEEAGRLGLHRLRCPHCEREVVAGAFCPACGASTARTARRVGVVVGS